MDILLPLGVEVVVVVLFGRNEDADDEGEVGEEIVPVEA